MSAKSVLRCCISYGFALTMLIALLVGSRWASDPDSVYGAARLEQTAMSTTMMTVLYPEERTGAPEKVIANVITSGLTITDIQTITGGLTVQGGLTVKGDLTVTQGLTVTGGLTVLGALLVSGGLLVDEPFVTPGKIITTALIITNSQTFTGGLSVAGGLTMTNQLTIAGGLSVRGKVTISGTLIVIGKPMIFHVHLPLISQLVIVTENGGFEYGAALWDEFSTTGQTLIRPITMLGVPPHSGQWAARLGMQDNEVALLAQGVLIPKDQSCLTYWQWTVSNDACKADYGGIGVNGYWVRPESLCAGTATGQWVHRQISMTHYSYSYTTTNIVLNFAVKNDYSTPSTMYIDDITFYPTAQCAENGQNVAHSTESTPNSVEVLVGQPIVVRPNPVVK